MKHIIIKNKYTVIIACLAVTLLLIPLLAMQFTNEVNWSLNDFIVAGSLLLGTSLLFVIVMRTINKKRTRNILFLIILSLLLIIWIEMVVGIFRTPIAGS